MIFVLSAEAFAFDHSHELFHEILKEHVSGRNASSVVNYSHLKRNPEKLLNYLGALSSVKESEFDKWSKNEQLAFLINAYNAFTLKLVTDNYPVKSIKDIGGLFSSPWKKKFFLLFGAETHLDHIEHDLIRPKYKEPRIHFALVCASIGCPNLASEPYVAARLNAQLENAAKAFLNDRSRNRYEGGASPVLYLSSLFKWYGKDFGPDEQAIRDFVIPRMTLKTVEIEKAKHASIQFLKYDWNLNDSK
ncbi:MAG: DUF547 domain-containing protein [Bacteriovoracia bacterium]